MKPACPWVAGLTLTFSLACGASPSREPEAPAPAPPSAAAAPKATASVSDLRSRAEAIVASSDRSEPDRALDAGRRPAELLLFAGIEPSMRVAELAAGGGYTAELLARAVGATGLVYAQNSKFILERFAEQPWGERLKKPVMKNVVRVDREFDEPMSPDVSGLDAVLMVLFYHDTVWLKTDRDKMNRAVFSALKPGGVFVIVDHSAAPQAGTTVAESLHRIEEASVRAELEKAGFVLSEEGQFLRNEADARDWNPNPRAAGERRGSSDRFVLKFRKPTT